MSTLNYIKSNCQKTEDVDDNNKNNIQGCFKSIESVQCKLNDTILEKEELQRQLNYAVDYIEDTIKKHKKLTCKLNDNYDELWNKYQKKITELNENKNIKKCLNMENDDLNRKCKILECNLKEHDQKNENLESLNNKLNLCLNNKNEEIERLKEYNQHEKSMLDKSLKDLSKTSNELEEKTEELKQKKEENFNLTSKIESLRCELSQKIEATKSEICGLKDTNAKLKDQFGSLRKKNNELSNVLYTEKSEKERLTEVLKQCENKNKTLKKTMENDEIERKDFNCKLEQEKMNVQNEMKELQTRIDRHTVELKNLEKTNGNLRSCIDELQYKLEAVIKNSDDKCRTLTENIDCIEEDRKKLQNDLTCKNREIDDMENKLCEMKLLYEAECENVSDLNMQLENLQAKQNMMPVLNRQCSNDGTNSQLDYKLLDELKSDCESLTAHIKESKSLTLDCNSEEKCQMFEKVITKCNSLTNYFDTF